ncbi:MAG TPA: DUF3488 and transglutaminase-like domain-containing protein [Terriglobia bacterium]|nr:DUF3488 and transglutaminase-like domain-containing protein [Terriglobia bacterium]
MDTLPAPHPLRSRLSAGAAPDPIDRYFEISLFGLVATGFLTLAFTGRIDGYTMALMGSALAGKAILLWRGSAFLLSPAWSLRLALAYIPFFVLDGLFLQASAVNALERWVVMAGIHLIFFGAAVELFSACRTRDYLFLAALAFAQMLAAATLTVGTAFLFFFAVFLLLAVSTFTSFEIRRARGRAADVHRLLSPEEKRRGLAPALSATSAAICLGVACLSVILFFVIPRANRGFFSSLSRPSDRMTGFSDDVELGQIGQIKRSSAVVMHIDAPELRPSDGIKWRGIALSAFDGKRWFNNSRAAMTVPGRRSFRFVRETPRSSQPSRLLHYTITLEPLASDAVFLAPEPLELTGPFRTLWQDQTGSVYMPSGSGSLVRYSVLSDVSVPTPASLAASPPEAPADIREMYLQLPPTDPRILELARHITAGASTNYDKARAVEQYLQANYGYTLELPPALPQDPIAFFLFESRRGHCEFFAASMAVLLRSLGIPARLVNGFLQGQFNDISGNYTVRASDAHSWVEVYFPASGWVSFDPTPAEGRRPQSHWLGRMALYVDAFQTFWEEWVINYDFLHQVTLARRLERTSREMRRDSRQYLQEKYRGIVAALRSFTDSALQHRGLLAAALGVLVLGMAALLGGAGIRSLLGDWSLRRRARSGHSRPQDATLLYLRLLRLFARRGVKKLPGQTPCEFAESVPEPLRPLVRDFTRLYLETRFGRLTGSVPQMSDLLTQIQSQPQSGPRC